MIACGEDRWWRGVLILALLLGAAAWGIRPEWHSTPGLLAFFLVPWAVSLVVWGLPHGAIDHFLLARLFRAQASGWIIAAAAGVYAALAVAVGVLWWRYPQGAFVGFILLTWLHWGAGDLWWSWTRDREALPSRAARLVFLLWRGSLPMVIPLLVDAGTYRRTAIAATGLWQYAGDWMVLETGGVRYAVLACGVILGLLRWMTGGQGRGADLDRREDLALVVFFSVVPTLPAVGLYFTFWHGWRHVLRLQTRAPVTPGVDRTEKRSFFQEAWPMTLVSLVLLLGLAGWLHHREDPWSLLGVYLLLIACLTVPHAMLVTWMDWKSGLWSKG